MPDNPFSSATAARLYAQGRPDYSSIATGIMRRLTGLEVPVEVALDVGCGTGISTLALAPLATSVIGIDPSVEMLRHRRQVAHTRYLVGAAEHIPFGDARCDFIGAGSAFHWFDQGQFLAEASRVATDDGWLVLHDHWFAGEMQNTPEFGRWSKERYGASYPPAPRDRSWRPPAHPPGWRHVAWERYDQQVTMNVDQLAAYLLSQSNLQVVIARGDQTEDELRIWLHRETAPFFQRESTATFLFGGFVAVHQQMSLDPH